MNAADFKAFRKSRKMTQVQAGVFFGCDQSFISQIELGKAPIPYSFLSKIEDNRSDLNDSGRGTLIPFYDDVVSVGGNHDKVANIDGVSEPTEYIDTGDWFKNATAAIRHYGDSMVEYPPGCILALKEVIERQLVIWGRDYVIETSEYRITKCVQRGSDKNGITAYSSNGETYPDGRMKHEPIEISWKDIVRIFEVLGYVVKKGSGTMVFSNSKK